jgi:heme-degrading monooxygenase HmoA
MASGYAYVWEFQVHPDMAEAFERHYGPAGTWAQLFRNSPDYIETLLLSDKAVPGRYLTVDRWRTEAAHDAFRAAYSQQYEQLDRDCERLTSGERSLGAFAELRRGPSYGPNPHRGSD